LKGGNDHAIQGDLMNAELLRRLVRAIADGSQDDLDRLVHKVVDTERRSGHMRLADDLDAILKQPRKKPSNRQTPITDGNRSVKELPISRRQRELLVSILPRDSLEHHMVLPTEVEERFARIEREFAARPPLRAARMRQIAWCQAACLEHRIAPYEGPIRCAVIVVFRRISS
jgi:hypothetical protein